MTDKDIIFLFSLVDVGMCVLLFYIKEIKIVIKGKHV